MSFVSHFVDHLIGSGKSEPASAPVAQTASALQPAPKPPPAAPILGSGDVEASARENMARLRKRKGFSDTILGSGLGETGTPQNNVQRTTLLGGGGGSY